MSKNKQYPEEGEQGENRDQFTPSIRSSANSNLGQRAKMLLNVS
jgi:hypothetical protein